MANFLMNPVVPGFTSEAFASKTKLVSQQEGASFASFIEKKSAEFDIGKNMFAVNAKSSISSEVADTSGDNSGEVVASSLAELLQQFMVKLNELADDNEVGAGKWQLTGLDTLKIKNLTENAGMGAIDQAALTTKTEDGGTTLGLVDFFSALQNNFSKLDHVEPVTAPETSLPLLQTILSKLGVSEVDIARISELSVNDVGGFDLAIFLNGLNALEEPMQQENLSQKQGDGIPLSPWETEQLQDLLATAGLTRGEELRLFPEETAAISKAMNGIDELEDASSQVVEMDLSRLKLLLQQTVNDAGESQPKVALPEFLRGLQNVLAQADFKDGGVGWSPVIQNTIASVFEELQKIVDLSKVSVEYPGGPQIPFMETATGLSVMTDDYGVSSIQSSIAIQEDGTPVLVPQINKNIPAIVELMSRDPQLSKDVPAIVEMMSRDPQVSKVISPDTFAKTLPNETNTNNIVSEIVETEVKTSVENVKSAVTTGRTATDLNAVSVAGGAKIDGEGALRKDAVKSEEISFGPKESILGSGKSSTVNSFSKASDDFSDNTFQKNIQQETPFVMSHVVGEVQYDDVVAKAVAPSHSQSRSPLQQLPFEQISTGVLRSLKDLQHQLTLTLHPKELGEVKVDMIVRNNHVSLSFLMENPKVKELMESNMQEFRQNMSQNGFQLEGCSVSVDQNNDSGFQEHQFAEGGQGMSEGARKVGLAEVNDLVAAGNALRAAYYDGQINLIA